MKDDLADQYTIKKWFQSLGFDRKGLKIILLFALLGGLGSVSIEWAFDQYLKETGKDPRFYEKNLLLAFVEGAFVAGIIITIPLLRKRS